MHHRIIWLHADNLHPDSAALITASGASAIFIWDDALLVEWRISLKRILFIYECLLELPITIRRGDVAQEVVAFAEEHHAHNILTMAGPSPRHRLICQQIADLMPTGSRLEVLLDAPFVTLPEHTDLRRFSRYWEIAKRELFPFR